MKKGLCVIIIAAILLVLGIVEQVLFAHMLRASKTSALVLQSLIVNEFETKQTLILENIDTFEGDWKYHENILCTFSINKEIEDVGMLIVKMRTATQHNQFYEAKQSVDLILFYLTEYDNIVSTRLQNIF